MSRIRLKVNREILAKEVLLIAKDGNQLGTVLKAEAISIAEKDSLDVVEVNPHASPPVCRILDYGKFRFKQTKKERESKKKHHVSKQKEIKLRPRIEEHDYGVKMDNAKRFLGKGWKVKITLTFRGREMAHKELGEAVLKGFCNEIVDAKCGAKESEPKLLGRNMSLVMSPLKSH